MDVHVKTLLDVISNTQETRGGDTKLLKLAREIAASDTQELTYTGACTIIAPVLNVMTYDAFHRLVYFMDKAELDKQEIGSIYKASNVLPARLDAQLQKRAHFLRSFQDDDKPLFSHDELRNETLIKSQYPLQWGDAIIGFSRQEAALSYYEYLSENQKQKEIERVFSRTFVWEKKGYMPQMRAAFEELLDKSLSKKYLR